MPNKSVIDEARDIHLAVDLIRLGARLQFLEAETRLSRDRLIKLYKEIRGVSPPKGLLPFSTDWFMTWMANIHASMFYNIHRFMVAQGGSTPIVALTKSYQLYLEQVQQQGAEPVLDFTRAWTLVRFFDSKQLQMNTCTRCTGQFVAHAHDGRRDYVCVLCRPPSRAGKPARAPVLPVRADGEVQDGAAPARAARPRVRPAAPAPAASSVPSASSAASQWLADVMRGVRTPPVSRPA